MVKTAVNMDLIKTIDDSVEVPDYSDESDEEEEFQPNKQKNKKKKDFSTDFEFVGSQSEYNVDTWNDLSKYIKRKGKSKVDEKIAKARKNIKNENTLQDENEGTGASDSEKENVDISDSEISLSEDELKKDNIKIKERAVGKKKRKKGLDQLNTSTVTAEEFFEDAPPFDDNASFYQINLSRPLLKAIGTMNFIHPTPIQAATIPVALAGRDVCGCAATGTGKTAAYMLPTLERLLFKPNEGIPVTRVLVLVPTRELGVQVYEVSRKLAQFAQHIDIGLAVGGLDLKAQETVLRKCPDIVIATPGRLIDHLKNTPSFSLESVEILVLDEADRMLDEYFQEQMTEIIKQCSRTRQTILFSATMTDAVSDLASVSLNKPVKIFVDSNQDVAFNLRQEFIKIRKDREGDREPVLAALVCRTFRDHTMVFVQTKKQAHRIHILLGLLGVRVGELHGDMTQPQRLEALRRFKDEELDVLIATDVAARGLDIHGVKSVINFLLPATLEHYIHRVGRTARAGRSGVSVSLAGEAERKLVKKIVKKSRNPVKSRLIPPEIVDKYRTKVSRLDEEINKILQEEWEERVMLRAENQANKAEKLLKGAPVEPKRNWFQTHKERMEEKERLLLTDTKEKKEKKQKLKNGKKHHSDDSDDDGCKGEKVKLDAVKKKKKVKEDTAELRVQREMSKVMLYQARIAKRKNKMKKIKSVVETKNGARNKTVGSQKRKATSFAKDLTDTSRKSVKRIRYDANVQKRQDLLNKKKPGGFGKKGMFNKQKRK